MSENNAQEPTMEEILASIRRIISEDDAGAPGGAAAPPPVEMQKDERSNAEHDDVLELTERVEPPPALHVASPPSAPPVAEPLPEPPRREPPRASAPPSVFDALDDLDVSTPAPPPAKPAPAPDAPEALVTPQAAERAAGHFGALTQSLAMPASGRTLEDLVRELLRPLLREWLENHLATIVEARVQAEVERISRGRGF